jgi:hypothetical protein
MDHGEICGTLGHEYSGIGSVFKPANRVGVNGAYLSGLQPAAARARMWPRPEGRGRLPAEAGTLARKRVCRMHHVTNAAHGEAIRFVIRRSEYRLQAEVFSGLQPADVRVLRPRGPAICGRIFWKAAEGGPATRGRYAAQGRLVYDGFHTAR